MSSNELRKRPLTLPEIVTWACVVHTGSGEWPTKNSGPIVGTMGETWLGVDHALRTGCRGLPGGSSLAQLLAEKYGVRNIKKLRRLSVEVILPWVDDHHQQKGAWPTRNSGSVAAAPGEKWQSIDQALQKGLRGLPGGSSLARLLAEHRGVRNPKDLESLTEEWILARVDEAHERTGKWPTAKSGPILGHPSETWLAVDMALRNGGRGLPGGSSLAMLLAEKRGVRNIWNLPRLSIPLVLVSVDAFHKRDGTWPHSDSGPIPELPGDTWNAIDKALNKGSRGLPGGCSLAKLLAVERGVRNLCSVPRLRIKTILPWMDAHHRRKGEWPTRDSGPIPESPGDTWYAIDTALRDGLRGLRPGLSLARLLARYRDRRNHLALPPLSKKKIVAWAKHQYEQTGQWPNTNSGPVLDVPGERWDLIDNALRQGHRGLPGGSSLRSLLAKKCGVRHPLQLEPLTEEEIRQWAWLHRQRTGSLPNYKSGPIREAEGETWAGIDYALRYGKRGLAGGSSLAKLLAETERPRPATEDMSPGDATAV